MTLAARKVAKWMARFILVLLAVGALHIAIIAYPTPLFAHEGQFGGYHLYSDDPLPADIERVIEDTTRRVEGMEHRPPETVHRVYLCNGPRRYAFFAFLTRKSPDSLAIGLSLTNETFVSMSRLRRFAAANQGVLRHTRFEGNLAEVLAHEVAHGNSIEALGYRTHLALPLWKSEGWAEYQANLAAIRSDPTYKLDRRIEQLLDDDYWGGVSSLARCLWESQLLVEFLGEVKGYRLADLAREDVTESSVREQMIAWYRAQ